MSLRRANLTKKRRPCLKCGRKFWTDKCHRICRRCTRSNARQATPPKQSYRVSEQIDSEELRALIAD